MEVNIIIWDIFQQVDFMTLMCIFRAGQGLDWPRCAPGSAQELGIFACVRTCWVRKKKHPGH